MAAGANIIRTMTKLSAAHADSPGCSIGINGETGQITDMKELGIWEPAAVKLQTLKTSVESAVLLLRIDDIVSGMKKSGRPAQSKPAPATQVEGDGDNVNSEQMLAE
jgi:T-complex protein 1 subunit gamma